MGGYVLTQSGPTELGSDVHLVALPEQVRQWLGGTPQEALALQKPAPDDEIEVAAEIEKAA